MSEKMLITQALDERDLLVKKINDKIAKATFTDTIKVNEEKVYDKRISREEFMQQAKSSYQQIHDLIIRFNRIDAAIIASNAATEITTSQGSFTVAAALSLRSRMGGMGAYGPEADFDGILREKMKAEHASHIQYSDAKNKQLQATADTMRLSILGKDSRTKEDKPLEVVDAYVKENTTQVVDPLDVKKRLAEIEEWRMSLLSELDTQIKVSNATTFIIID